jgi:undecaprenyl diphosphate synthase
MRRTKSDSANAQPAASEQELLASIDRSRLPRHVAIIMDGNGRWARGRHLPRVAGHRAGRDSARAIIGACDDLGIENLSLYTFSAENWRRSRTEVRALMHLIETTLRRELPELHKRGARVQGIGRREELPASLQAELDRVWETTRDNPGLGLYLCINYGGRTEIVDAARSLAREAAAGRLDPETIDEAMFAQHLYRPEMPDPDLLIRSAGEMRLSNFLLWESAYTELWITPVLWPDFGRPELYQAVLDYQRRERKFGGRPHG